MKQTNELKAGIFLFTAVIFLAAGIWILGQERQTFSSKSNFQVSFKNVQGLSRGAPIRLSGITIGRVESIGFSEKSAQAEVEVIISINQEYLSRITADAVASIQTQGLLGDKFLSIHPGKEINPLPAGSRIKARELKDVADTIQRASAIINRTAKISEDLSAVLDDFKDTTLISVNKTVENLAEITNQIKSGNGLIGKLIYSDKEAATILTTFDKLNKTAKNLEHSSRALAEGTGTLGALLLDSSLYDNLVEMTDDAKRSFVLKKAIQSTIKK